MCLNGTGEVVDLRLAMDAMASIPGRSHPN
jgi:hypothetical protein